MLPHHSAREQLDRLFAYDASASLVFGVLSLLAPHGLLAKLGGGFYNHDVHEILRLYGCLRIACGWILWHIRKVDNGIFRKHVCEAQAVCYSLQALAVARAQFTEDRFVAMNWGAIGVLVLLAAAYGSFRFRKGGSLIKVYEMPNSNNSMV